MIFWGSWKGKEQEVICPNWEYFTIDASITMRRKIDWSGNKGYIIGKNCSVATQPGQLIALGTWHSRLLEFYSYLHTKSCNFPWKWMAVSLTEPTWFLFSLVRLFNHWSFVLTLLWCGLFPYLELLFWRKKKKRQICSSVSLDEA